MITLYHCVDARSFRPLWALEELRLPYELRVLPFPPRAEARPYLSVNPLGTVPTLIDGAISMTESAAIVQYLVTTYGPTPLSVERSQPSYGAFLNWLHFGEATLTFPQTLVLRYSRLEPVPRRQPQIVEDYSRWFLARLRAVEAAVTNELYLCAGRFTAADISVGYALLLASTLELSNAFPESVANYWHRLQVREAYVRARTSQDLAATAQGVAELQVRRFL